jgi:hypothetical protein
LVMPWTLANTYLISLNFQKRRFSNTHQIVMINDETCRQIREHIHNFKGAGRIIFLLLSRLHLWRNFFFTFTHWVFRLALGYWAREQCKRSTSCIFYKE